MLSHVYRQLQGPQGLGGAGATTVFQLVRLLADVIHNLGPQLTRETHQRPGKCLTIRVFSFRRVDSEQFFLDVLVNLITGLILCEGEERLDIFLLPVW